MPSDGPSSVGGVHIDALLGNDKAARALARDIHAGINFSLQMWRLQAALTGVVINALTATGGQLIGPPLEPLIMSSPSLAAKTDKRDRKIASAIASVIGTSWTTFCATVKVPGLPWYPAFVSFPGPVAPPMPNVPTPFVALTQVRGVLASGPMKTLVRAKLHPDKSADGVIDAVMVGFDLDVMQMLLSMTVKMVMGTGPVPSFAPPFVPAGPVIMGTGTMAPGGLI